MKTTARNTLTRLLAIIALGTLTSPTLAQSRKADGLAFALYVQSVGAQMLARTCERAAPGYLDRFQLRYESWAKQNAPKIERGEQLFLDTLRDDPKARENPKFAQIEAVRKTLASPPPADSTPIVMSDALRAACEDNINNLSAN